MSLFDKITDTLTGKSGPPGAPGPDMQQVLDALAALGARPLETLSPAQARANPTPTDAVQKVLRDDGKDPAPTLGIDTRDLDIPAPGGAIRARVYTPQDAPDKIRPVLGYWHGGGWVIADLDVYDASPRAIARGADCIVVSFHYRQAPEHKFPAAHEDAIACYRWLLDHAADFNGDPARIAIMGESAGGNLAANVSIAARDRGLPPPVHQVLVYPVANADVTTESYVQHADAKPLSKAGMEWFVSHVFSDKSQARDPRIDLVNANLAGLPPTTIVLAEIDPLRSDGEMLGERLEQAGVDVETKTYMGVTHEFFGMGLVVDEARKAEGFVSHNLRKAFGTALLPI